MIDYKVGEKTEIKTTIEKHNYNEDNMLAQIRALREIVIKAEEKREKQKRYGNIILTLILILLFFTTIPICFILLLVFG